MSTDGGTVFDDMSDIFVKKTAAIKKKVPQVGETYMTKVNGIFVYFLCVINISGIGIPVFSKRRMTRSIKKLACSMQNHGLRRVCITRGVKEIRYELSGWREFRKDLVNVIGGKRAHKCVNVKNMDMYQFRRISRHNESPGQMNIRLIEEIMLCEVKISEVTVPNEKEEEKIEVRERSRARRRAAKAAAGPSSWQQHT